eukprot:677094-Pleurochrysis_carterae.AAC.1
MHIFCNMSGPLFCEIVQMPCFFTDQSFRKHRIARPGKTSYRSTFSRQTAPTTGVETYSV